MAIVFTTWHRLEPRVRGGDPQQGLRAAVHDPLWLLGRQWQLGEWLGEDAGFPVSVRTATVQRRLSRYRPGGADGVAVDYDPDRRPLEAMVEREPPPPPTVRERLDAWTRLRALLEGVGRGDVADALAADAAHHMAWADEPSAAESRLRRLAGDSAVDGLAVARTLADDPGAVPAEIAAVFLSWIQAAFPPGAGDAWIQSRLEYRFAVGVAADIAAAGQAPGREEVSFSAPEYTGHRLDWFDVDVEPRTSLQAAAAAPVRRVSHTLPTRVGFPGMPAERFWEFEDAAVNLGAIGAAAEDLGRMLAVEFATVFGNDWWSVPVPATFGSVLEVQSLVVRDSFGDHVLIEPTARAAAGRSAAPWRMFAPTGSDPARPLLFLAPVISGGLDGEPVEDVLLLRDEMANMAWAVERIVEGADGRPHDRRVDYGTRLSAAETPDLTSVADLLYLLQTRVPEHWIPLLPVRDPRRPGDTRSIVLRRGRMRSHDGSMRPITALGTLLSPRISPWILQEEELPRAGLRLSRIPACARWIGGTSHHWMSRRVGVGRGEGSSGLAFDLAVLSALE